MSYYIECDYPKCNEIARVEEIDELPSGWVKIIIKSDKGQKNIHGCSMAHAKFAISDEL